MTSLRIQGYSTPYSSQHSGPSAQHVGFSGRRKHTPADDAAFLSAFLAGQANPGTPTAAGAPSAAPSPTVVAVPAVPVVPVVAAPAAVATFSPNPTAVAPPPTGPTGRYAKIASFFTNPVASVKGRVRRFTSGLIISTVGLGGGGLALNHQLSTEGVDKAHTAYKEAAEVAEKRWNDPGDTKLNDYKPLADDRDTKKAAVGEQERQYGSARATKNGAGYLALAAGLVPPILGGRRALKNKKAKRAAATATP